MSAQKNKILKIFREIAIALALFTVLFGGLGYWRDSRDRVEGVADFSLLTLQGTRVSSAELTRPTVLVFWATWCAPCKVELARLERLVKNGTISRDSVFAVSIQEERELVSQVAAERGYEFPIGLDSDGRVASLFNVQGTPTIVLRRADGTIEWMTTGLSPSLEYRVTRFLAASNR